MKKFLKGILTFVLRCFPMGIWIWIAARLMDVWVSVDGHIYRGMRLDDEWILVKKYTKDWVPEREPEWIPIYLAKGLDK